MKLFNKTIDKKLFAQYALGSELENQEVVVKIFNPYGRGTWYIMNSDPADPDYLWAIVDLGYGAEVGSVSRKQLENYRNKMGWGFERDLSFDPVNAEKLYKGLHEGKFFAEGGETPKSGKTKLVVLGEHTLGYIQPNSNYMGILHASGLRNSPYNILSAPVFITTQDKIRLASKKDFEDFNVSFEGYENEEEYEYAKEFADGGSFENGKKGESTLAETEFTPKGKPFFFVVDNVNNGVVLNEIFNQWNNIKDEAQHKRWTNKVKSTMFGTYKNEDVMNTFKKWKPVFPSEWMEGAFFRELSTALKLPLPKGKIEFDKGGSLPEKIKIKEITLSTYDHSVFAKNLPSFEKANEVIYFVWKSGKYSNVRYKLEYQDGETIEGVIDIEPKEFHAPHKNNILSWHLKTYWGNVAKSSALPYLPQKFIDEAKELVSKYAFYDEGKIISNDGLIPNLEVSLEAFPNPDHSRRSHSGTVRIKENLVKVSTIEEAKAVVREFIDDNDLGGGNFTGGNLYSNGEKIGHISYNGRLWNNDDTPMSFADGGDINAFSMKLTKGTANSPDIITTQEQEVNFAKGGRIRDRKYVNHSEDYEVNYAKGKNRHGYGNLSFADGGTLNVHDSTAFFDTMYAKGGATTKTYKKGDKVTTEFGTYYVNGADSELQKVIDRNKGEMQESALAKLSVNFVNAKYFTEDNDVAPQMRSWFDDKKQPTEAQVKNAMIWSYDSYGDYQIKAGGGSKSDNIYVSHLRSTIADPLTGNDKDVVILKKYSNNFKDVLITIKEVEALQKLTESSKVRESRRKDNYRGAIGFLFRCELLGKYADSNGTEVPAETIEKMYKITRDHASEAEINEQIDHIIKVRTEDAHGNYMEDTPQRIADREVKLQKQIRALEVVRKRLLGKSTVADEAKTHKKQTLQDSSKKYILKADLATVTVNQNGKTLVYPSSAVFNGANLLADGGDLQKKANYIPKRDVISVELKSGESIKPANGYWIKKDAKPIGDEKPPVNEIKFSLTTISKGFNGWKAKTNVDNLKGYDWEIVTMKNSKGELDSHARGGHSTDKGTHSIFTFTLYQDPFKTLIRSNPSRITDKVVSAQHDKALEEFKKYIETDKFEAGGETTFADKSSAIAKSFVGKKVKPEYQQEYGKVYSKEEAKEVGNKIAGAQKAQYDKNHPKPKKMFFGGFSSKKKPPLVGKQFSTTTGDYVQILSQDDSKNSVTVFRVSQTGLGVKPHNIPISELIIPEDNKMASGGAMKKVRKDGSGNPFLTRAVIKAREIRKKDETWGQAMKRAYAIVK